MKTPECDLETGVCAPAPVPQEPGASAPTEAAEEIVYVGDPMCSWCWGIAPNLQQLHEFGHKNAIPFRLVVGGLRPGGGDAWNRQFKQFLEHHWREIATMTGQEFRYQLLERESFDYDTEPACRAVVAARPLAPENEMDFFYAVQRRFYVDNEDPKTVEFYRPICAELDIDYSVFAERFDSDDVRAETLEEFRLNRSWGVTGYPTVFVRVGARHHPLARGYATFDQMRDDLIRAVPRLS
ncbi:DsbA family protein [Elongatibacter sediminis]|uniref:DsbA family protein n=1 Tax=Elongatibacter sediminis TaxID=3119006 RepID=A0AAW9R696_9GAMM